jgi:predicted acyltransferase (DUF342 family)
MFPSLQSLFKKMNFAARVQNVLSTLKGDKDALLTENASLKEQLAAALANDVADAQAAADAQSAAEVARATADAAVAETTRLQGIVDADATEDAALEALLGSLEAPAAAPVAEVAATEEAPVATEEVVTEETTEG